MAIQETINGQGSPERVLLINPPVYDIRFEWEQYQRPTGLLRLSSWLRHQDEKVDVKLIDTLHHLKNKRLRKQKSGSRNLDGVLVNRWRYGMSSKDLERAMSVLSQQGWIPDKIYIECFTTFWWEGTKEVIQQAREHFPDTSIILMGAYANLCPDHAKDEAGVDEILPHKLRRELALFPSDLSFYEFPPYFVYLSVGNGARSAGEVIDEIERILANPKHQGRSFAFGEHAIITHYPDLYCSILQGIIERKIKVTLFALGTTTPAELIDHPEIASLMKQAGYKTICFADDRAIEPSSSATDAWLESMRQVATICHQAGFQNRTEHLVGSLCIGRPGESLSERARLAIQISHYLGSVICWPYQPDPGECPGKPLEEQNSRLFPFRQSNGYTYQDYINMLGLTTILNAKHRNQTFDFLGDGLVARLLRESFVRQEWHRSHGIELLVGE